MEIGREVAISYTISRDVAAGPRATDLESVSAGTAARKSLTSTFDRGGEAERTEVTWVAVSGSWRYVLPGLREAVHKEVAAALAAGKSVVTGGALGTDYWATEMALSIDPARLKVIVPTS